MTHQLQFEVSLGSRPQTGNEEHMEVTNRPFQLQCFVFPIQIKLCIFSLVSNSLPHPQTKENKISTKDNIEPQHIHAHVDKRKFERNSSLTEYRRSISTKFVETPVFSLAESLYGVFPRILGQSISVTYPTRQTFSDHVTRNASATSNNEA